MSSKDRIRVHARQFRPNIILLGLLMALPFGASSAQEVDNFNDIADWLQQGVHSALLTGEQADVMLEALRGHSEATEAFIRTQVAEGMNLAAAAKARVAEYFLVRGTSPMNRTDARMTANASDTQGKYVSSVDVLNGEVIVTYGSQAHSDLAGKTLVLTALSTEDNSIVWNCGFAGAASRADLTAIGANTSARATTVDPKFLPNACRQ